jgi:hypothetical protein
MGGDIEANGWAQDIMCSSTLSSWCEVDVRRIVLV